jgi:hypothetical protein
MATVKFNDPSEFVRELRRDREKIERKILRLTCGHRHEYPMTVLTVLATALVGSVVVRLERRCGSYMTGDSNGMDQTLAAVRADCKLVEAAAHELGLEVRAGVYES